MRLFILCFFVFSFVIKAQEKKCNCCTEKHSEFDFWKGTWTVTKPDGSIAGTNIIDKIQNNCILRENWTSAKGNFTGTSTNFYNYAKKQWEQIWVDNQGSSLHLKGNRIDNRMILKTDVAQNKEGNPYYHKVTWTLNEDGTVRQYWETITNDKDITVVFDGLYKKTE
ncbi:hypothetical protein [Hyunsoonleella pacifica]|uniref:DUF1579 domain-containing protein n=1 Tax=Hyunsoonleella pacifica TaxID=1080224 RepID=A0A4Q9FUZ3_9FLAO|nr:hypothetical protein [Hyunsoonleella pacifica]TBN19059.1 hypothetical protein EYD46_03045 [Hyunsoonleella pacifica]GGD06988.1 hypothetical protein GCM10011368_06080 [Hyunsoonleella pacifica]